MMKYELLGRALCNVISSYHTTLDLLLANSDFCFFVKIFHSLDVDWSNFSICEGFYWPANINIETTIMIFHVSRTTVILLHIFPRESTAKPNANRRNDLAFMCGMNQFSKCTSDCLNQSDCKVTPRTQSLDFSADWIVDIYKRVKRCCKCVQPIDVVGLRVLRRSILSPQSFVRLNPQCLATVAVFHQLELHTAANSARMQSTAQDQFL